MKAAAFSGDYCDLKFVKTRKVAQITIEIPLEHAAAFVAAFGAPDPVNGVPVGFARLEPGRTRIDDLAPVQEIEAVNTRQIEPAKDRKSWGSLPCSQQAAIRCGEPSFWRFLAEEYGLAIENSEDAANAVRTQCDCVSRKELDFNGGNQQNSWNHLEADYQTWLRVLV